MIYIHLFIVVLCLVYMTLGFREDGKKYYFSWELYMWLIAIGMNSLAFFAEILKIYPGIV